MPYSKTKIKNILQKLSDNWNPDYWIFAADSGLHLMKKDEDGDRIVNTDGGMSQSAVISSFIGIDADGGDW